MSNTITILNFVLITTYFNQGHKSLNPTLRPKFVQT
jgi:hypothetical protein